MRGQSSGRGDVLHGNRVNMHPPNRPALAKAENKPRDGRRREPSALAQLLRQRLLTACFIGHQPGTNMQHLDPHERPPERIRDVYKSYQKMKPADLDTDNGLLNLTSLSHATLPDKVHVVRELDTEHLARVFRTFMGADIRSETQAQRATLPLAVYEHDDMPGKELWSLDYRGYSIPSCPLHQCIVKHHSTQYSIPPEVQFMLLSRLLHRDLSNPAHLTNIHTHYNITYPPENSSFFTLPRTSQEHVATPLDPNIHKPLTVAQLLNKKMRWTTLGGQYDWTAKRYPESPPPPFPQDIKNLLESIFTDTKAEAAIVNLYSPGDTLSVHRDVAETSSHGLVSVSLGCDAIFVLGTDEKVLTLRLRSGSAVYMSGSSRFAWHGVPQIVASTCPSSLQDWPGGSLEDSVALDEWKGWMASKRVNLNVRQMWN
jgi:alkylated DNA repair protein alkB family protein 1